MPNVQRIFTAIKPLFCEDRGISLGRVAFWIVFSLRVYFWLKNPEMNVASMTEILGFLLVYNLYKQPPPWLGKFGATPNATSCNDSTSIKEALVASGDSGSGIDPLDSNPQDKQLQK